MYRAFLVAQSNKMVHDTPWPFGGRLCVDSQGSRMPRALQVTLLAGQELKPALLILLHHGSPLAATLKKRSTSIWLTLEKAITSWSKLVHMLQ
jgi:hypothetical protein